MSKVIEIRIFLKQLLKTLHPRVFFNVADSEAEYPYIVFDLPNSIDDGILENFVLDIDVWDINPDTTVLETLVDSIDNALNKETFLVNNQFSMTIYRENRLTLTDDDSRIRRRKYVYQARTV